MKLKINKAKATNKQATVKKADAITAKAAKTPKTRQVEGMTPAQLKAAGISEPYALRAVDKFLPGAPTKHEVIVRGKYGFCLIPKGARVNVEGRTVPFKANCTVEFLDGLRCKAMFAKEKDANGDPLVYGVRETADGLQPVEKNTGTRGMRWQRKTWGQLTKLEEDAVDKLLK